MALAVAIVDDIDANIISAIEDVVPAYDLLLRGINIPIVVDLDQTRVFHCNPASALRMGLHQYGIMLIESNIRPG